MNVVRYDDIFWEISLFHGFISIYIIMFDLKQKLMFETHNLFLPVGYCMRCAAFHLLTHHIVFVFERLCVKAYQTKPVVKPFKWQEI